MTDYLQLWSRMVISHSPSIKYEFPSYLNWRMIHRVPRKYHSPGKHLVNACNCFLNHYSKAKNPCYEEKFVENETVALIELVLNLYLYLVTMFVCLCLNTRSWRVRRCCALFTTAALNAFQWWKDVYRQAAHTVAKAWALQETVWNEGDTEQQRELKLWSTSHVDSQLASSSTWQRSTEKVHEDSTYMYTIPQNTVRTGLRRNSCAIQVNNHNHDSNIDAIK